MYTLKNYRTKAALKRDVLAGIAVDTYQPGPFPGKRDGSVTLEGPHYPEPHTWYATATIENGIIVKVK